ncbi:hypothetical protein SDC9_152127 [bioreactor metagenome]|uniref:HMA domain-containing protein n=1 Tax=bioreactor metagenome TaxID=1076179 RepID=A0A645EUL1_9ZZZZ
MKTKKFNITGMTCSACSARIEKNLSKTEGVTEVNVNLLSNNMTVKYDESILSEADIIKVVLNTGYGASSAEKKKETPDKNDKTDAEKEFEELKKNPFIKDVYKIITLDDSTVRFAVVFNFPVQYEIKEYKDPAKIEISLKKLKYDRSKVVYSVRSASYEMGEGLGIVEEVFFKAEDKRILKDESGKFAVELKYYDSKEEAEKALNDFKDEFGDIVKLFIEERKEGKAVKTIQQ